MKKQKRRVLLVVLILIIPALAIAGYTLFEHFKDTFPAWDYIVEKVKTEGWDGIKSMFIAPDNDSGELDNFGLVLDITSQMQEQRAPVTVFKAFVTGFRDTLPALGSLKGHRETKLSYEKSGVIAVFNYKEGDLVPKGALICSLDKSESQIKVRYAESKLKEAQANLSLAENKLDRVTQKYELGGTSRALYEEALLEFERHTHSVEIARIDVENASLELSKCDVFAPYDGLLGNKYVQVGENITPNTLVCDLIDVSYIVVQIGVVERDIEKVSIGQDVSIYVDAYPERDFLGKVETISPVIEGQSRTFSVEIKVANPQKLLLPGMFARVKINVFEKKNALVIPSSAVIKFDNKTMVMVVNPDTEIVHERPVSVEYSTTDYAVIDRGLKEGELVVVEDQQGLAEGTPIKIIEQQVPEAN
ncbi:MAG: efflux RND transporter periplasmic adaptor subunit [Candidatus Auribacterota bacterium]